MSEDQTDAADVVWGSAEDVTVSHALLYSDRELNFWDRVKIAWHYIWTGDFQDPRFIAYFSFDEEEE